MKENEIAVIAILIFVFILVAFFSRFGYEITIDLSRYYHQDFAFILWTLGVDILWVFMVWFVVSKFNEFPVIVFLRWLGRNITVFYIVQWLIIGNIATAIYQTQALSRFGYWVGIIFLATIGITLIYERTKLVNIKGRKVLIIQK